MYQIVAQSIGVAAMILAYFIYTAKERRTLIALKFISDAMWAVHYFMLGAVSGGLLNIINMGRETVFQLKSTKTWAKSRIWVLVFIAVNLTSTILSWQGPQSLLPAIGASISVIGLWCADPMHIRMFSFPGISMWLIYSIITGTISGMICNVITLISIGIGLYRDIRSKKQRNLR